MTREDQEAPQAGPARSSSSFRTLLYGACLTVLAVLLLAGYDGSRDLARLKAREAQLEERLQSTEAGIAALNERISRLRSDPYTLEKTAREELGLSRPGELVVILPNATSRPPERP